MYCARSSSSQSYEGVYLYKVYYYSKVHIGIPCRMAMRDKNDRKIEIGMIVMYGRKHGQKTKGEVVKINLKRLKVKQLEGRGRHVMHAHGSLWTVPPSLCEIVSTSDPNHWDIGIQNEFF